MGDSRFWVQHKIAKYSSDQSAFSDLGGQFKSQNLRHFLGPSS